MSNIPQPEPWGRSLLAVMVAGGAIVSHNSIMLGILWLVCFITLLIQGEGKPALKFLIRLWLPLAAGLAIVWGLAVRGTPDHPGSGATSGLEYAGTISLRLAALAALFQCAFLSLRGLRLAKHWSKMGLPPNAVAGLVSIFQLWPDFAHRTDQVVAARCARGLMPNRSFLTRLKQLPFSFRTLFLSTLGSSIDRAERWQAEMLPTRLVAAALRRKSDGTWAGTALWGFAAAAWSILALQLH